MYNQKLMEIFKNPLNAGGLQGANGTAKLAYLDGAYVVKFYVFVNENGIIENARFKTMGSANLIAVSSIVAGLMIGKTVDEAEAIATLDILEVAQMTANDMDSHFIDECGYVMETMFYAIQDYKIRKEKEEKAKEEESKKS